MARDFLILGSGFTGSPVARRLRERGLRVLEIRRAGLDLTAVGSVDRLRRLVAPGCVVLHSLPALEGGADRLVLAALRDRAQRVVYLSTTSVYGDTFQVDEHTSPSPRTPSERDRLATEQAVSDGPWSSLILRPAAIYGPGRGVHVAMREGRHKLMGDGSNFISRIHVEDLAAIAEASLPSELEGAYPVADEHPCPAREIAEFCSTLLSVPMPPPAPLENIPATLRTNRRVDGSAIRRALNITLQYPSYREGIPAAIAVERTR